MTTKRVESLRAPCLDASSTLATSTSKRAIYVALFSFRRLGRSTCGGVAELSAIYGVGELLRNLEIASDK